MPWLIILIPVVLLLIFAVYIDYRGKKKGRDGVNMYHNDQHLSNGTQINNAAEMGKAAGRDHHQGPF
ncbi:hypothetical protein [Fictibacillus barbaricus]|uniref:Uncharacterized protein n=1 Tax=Fictibacillus barbaricus TaxID=182136 RepID=A0ABS2ZE78_9BACL|nr:hypothetical protein [Fictibacillus barbaricus]MBN3545015.1 hypothetical protein [Fictibacillus barbaricus]GGB62381.1 hypothetical protein GCM10007199_30390 [Fictibacillus barbaricus]